MVRNPIDVDLLGDQRNAYQKLTAPMVRFVTVLQKIDSGSVSADLTVVQGGSVSLSWFVVAELLQAQGLDKHAMVNLEKAIANGLDDEIDSGLGELMRDALVGLGFCSSGHIGWSILKPELSVRYVLGIFVRSILLDIVSSGVLVIHRTALLDRNCVNLGWCLLDDDVLEG